MKDRHLSDWPRRFDDLSHEPLKGFVGPYDAPSAGAPAQRAPLRHPVGGLTDR